MSQLDAFRDAYAEATREVLPLFNEERLAQMGLHNPGWGPGRHDVGAYLGASVVRYSLALEMASRVSGRPLPESLLDAGGFMGTFPLALARLGVDVTITEKYSYYDGAFDELADLLVVNGVRVIDADITERDNGAELGKYSVVTCMAVLEHLAHSPRAIMGNLRDALTDSSVLIVEVPNIAAWHRRVQAVAGKSVHPPLRDVYDARIPFTGHHREYTASEVRDLLGWSGLELMQLKHFSYTPGDHLAPHVRLISQGPRWWRSARELIMASARPSQNGLSLQGLGASDDHKIA